MNGFDQKCEVCGGPVRVEGNVTKHYENAYDTAQDRIYHLTRKVEELEREVARLKEFEFKYDGLCK